MAEQQTNGKALRKEISAVFAGVSIIKQTSLGAATEDTESTPLEMGERLQGTTKNQKISNGVTEMKKYSNSSESSVLSVARIATVAQLVALQAALVPRDRPQQKTIRSKQIGFAPIINVFSRLFRRMLRSRSRRDRRRLRSISEHLLINMRG